MHICDRLILRANVLRCLMNNGSRKSPVQSLVRANMEEFCATCCPRIVDSFLIRFRRTRRVLFRVQHGYEETILIIKRWETAAISLKTQTNCFLQGQQERETACEIFCSGRRSSQILEDTEVLTSANISRDSDLERPTKVAPRKHSIHTHFPRDQNGEVCKQTKIQSYLCKTKTSLETQRILRKMFEPSKKPKVMYVDNSLEVGKSCEDLSWSHRTSTPHRSERNGTAEGAGRSRKEETSAVLYRSGLDEKWWADSVECLCYL